MINQREIINKATNSMVSCYFDKRYQKYVVEKLLSTENKDKFERYCLEIEFLKLLKNSDLAITYLDHTKEKRLNTYTCRIITDYYENGNLDIYTSSLIKSNQQYKHSMKYYLKTFISFFADLQIKGIAHRDIKPQNIFVTADGQMKIGDFGSSIFKRGNGIYTIQGTAYYLSPELRKGYAEYLNRRGNVKIVYCPYKSDVFSLGLVFLGMARMNMIYDLTEIISELEETIKTYLLDIQDSEVKEIISLMLRTDSKNRPDFIELKSKVFDFLGECDSECLKCRSSGDLETLVCCFCSSFIHRTCLKTIDHFFCEVCSNPLKRRCCLCFNFFDPISSERKCKICMDLNNSELNIFIPINEKPTVPPFYICRRDKTQTELLASSQAYRCNTCYRCYCSICKQTSHGGSSCLKVSQPYLLYCKCKAKILAYGLDGIFFSCKNCGFRCIVCFKSFNSDHLSCARSFEIRK